MLKNAHYHLPPDYQNRDSSLSVNVLSVVGVVELYRSPLIAGVYFYNYCVSSLALCIEVVSVDFFLLVFLQAHTSLACTVSVHCMSMTLSQH